MTRSRIKTIERAARKVSDGVTLPIAWDMSGPRLINARIEDADEWPGYILRLMRAGLLKWERTRVWLGEGGKLECRAGPEFTAEFDPELCAATITVNSVMGGLIDDGYEVPQNTQEFILWLEMIEHENQSKATGEARKAERAG